MTASQPRPSRAPRATAVLRRTVRRGARVLCSLYREQVRAQEIIWQAGRALPAARTGPLEWVLTLDGYQLAGSYLPDPS